jgi:regulator of sirC expression with transglutaminase-like and TPR domain
MAYFKAAKAAQGLPDAKKSLSLRPDEPEALDTRGHIFEALGRRQEAIADFRRALAKMPDLQESKDALKRLGASTDHESRAP